MVYVDVNLVRYTACLPQATCVFADFVREDAIASSDYKMSVYCDFAAGESQFLSHFVREASNDASDYKMPKTWPGGSVG